MIEFGHIRIACEVNLDPPNPASDAFPCFSRLLRSRPLHPQQLQNCTLPAPPLIVPLIVRPWPFLSLRHAPAPTSCRGVFSPSSLPCVNRFLLTPPVIHARLPP
jgi:hypothetical protein